MANAAAICTSFKVELLNAVHQFGSPTITSRTSLTAPTADTFKCALYTTSGSIGAGTTAYSATNEVGNSGDYSAGGKTFTWVAPNSSGTTAFTTPSASISWTGVTFTTDCCLLYNSTQSNKAIATYALGTIGVGQQVTGGNFTLTMPTNDASTGLLRIA